jgi:hypothetical protein
MSDEPGVTSLDDILYDLEGTRKADGPCSMFFAREAEAIPRGHTGRTTRGGSSSGAEPPAGHRLLAPCAPSNRKRFETLLYFEEKLRPDDDHGYLIGPACQILESELERLLSAPVHGIAESLIAALRVAGKDQHQAAILEKWAARQVPTTIGTASLVLLALRRGREQQLRPVLEFLAAHFGPGYQVLLANKELGQCLDLIRTRFRNPACHGTATFDPEAYKEFARLVIANQRFAAWHASGPDPPEPGAGAGILHHHWQHTRRSETRPAQPTRPITLGLRLSVSREVGPDRFEPVATTQSPHAARTLTPLRTGERVRIEVVVEQRGYVTVFAIGPTGRLSLLYPDEPASDTPSAPVEAHQPLHIVNVELTPPDGRERLFAVWSCAPLPLGPTELQSLAEAGQLVGSRPSHATPDMERVQQAMGQSGPDDWHAVGLELDHQQ